MIDFSPARHHFLLRAPITGFFLFFVYHLAAIARLSLPLPHVWPPYLRGSRREAWRRLSQSAFQGSPGCTIWRLHTKGGAVLPPGMRSLPGPVLFCEGSIAGEERPTTVCLIFAGRPRVRSSPVPASHPAAAHQPPRPHALHCSILLPSSPWLSSNANAVSNSQGKSPQQPQCSSPFASQQVFSGQASPQNGFSIAVQPSHPTPSRYSHSLQSMPHRDSIIRTYSISRFIARKTIRRPSIRPLVTCALQ